MLVLTRRKDQRIMIGDDVVVTVLDVKGDTVRIGVEAPRDLQVHREEVHEALTQANLEAVLRPASPVGLPRPLAASPSANAVLRPAKPGPPA